MWSRGRTSSAGIHGRRFFRCCYFQLWKNLLSWLPVEEVLTRDGTEKSYSAVVNLQLRKNLIPWLAAEEVLQWDGTEEGSSIVVTLNAEDDFSAETLRGILENIKNCWVHQQSCWVPLAIPLVQPPIFGPLLQKHCWSWLVECSKEIMVCFCWM